MRKNEKSYTCQRYIQSIHIQSGSRTQASILLKVRTTGLKIPGVACAIDLYFLLKRKVNIMRLPYLSAIMILLLFSAQLRAGEKVVIGTPLSENHSGKEEKKWYYPFEISQLKIKQSNDGRGIIKEVTCKGCDYQFVKITEDTSVFVNGKKVNLLRARERAGKEVYIEFDRDTAEVKYISWAE